MRWSNRFRRALVLGAVGLLLACTSEAPARSGGADRDSAGIAVHEYSSRPGADVAHLEGVEVVSIGAIEGGEAETFNRIRDMAVDPEGRIHVLDAGDQIVDAFDPTGTWLHRYGGPGEGPAEFQGASLLIPMGDSMGVYDYRNQKLAWFGSDGSLLATRRWELPVFEIGFPGQLAPIPGGLAGVFHTGCSMPPPEDRRPTWKLLTLGYEGDVRDTVAVRFRSDLLPLYGERFCSTIPSLAGAGYQLAAREDGTVAFTAGRDYEVLLLRLSASGEEEYRGSLPTPDRIVRRALEPRSVTAAQVEDYRTRYLTVSEDDPTGRDRVEAIQQALDSTDVPGTHPQIGALLWDDRGRLWVGRTVIGDAPSRTWDVYDTEGRLVAEAVLPAELENVLVAREMVWGTVRDDLEVMYVKGLRLEEANAPGR